MRLVAPNTKNRTVALERAEDFLARECRTRWPGGGHQTTDVTSVLASDQGYAAD